MKIKNSEVEIELLDLAVTFTRRHKETDNLPKSQREVELLGTLIPGTLLGPEDTDLLAGRVAYPIAGFSNQRYPEGGCGDVVGYYFDRHKAERIVREHGLEDTAYDKKVREMIVYWGQQASYRNITDRMDEPMRMALPTRRFWDKSSVCHRLYRIASPSVDYAPLLNLGLPAFRQQLSAQLKMEQHSVAPVPKRIDFLQAGITYLDLFDEILGSYAAEFADLAAREDNLSRRSELNRIAVALGQLRKGAPQTFFEAVQIINAYLITGYTCNAFGRLDDSLGGFLVRDLENAILTEDEAVQILLSWWRILGEHYGNSRLTIGGRGRVNPDSADVFCRIALEATKQFYTRPSARRRVHVMCPQVAFRISSQTPESLRQQAMDTIAAGTTFPSLYSDEANIPSIANAFRIEEEEAAQYTFFDCGEYIIHNRSIGTPSTIINLPKALEVALHDGVDPKTGLRLGPPNPTGTTFADRDSVWQAYCFQTEFALGQCARFHKLVFDVLAEECSFMAISLMMPDCRRHGLSLLDGGCERLGGTIETYGNITTADSLFAIEQAVFENRWLTVEELIKMQDSDFATAPDMRQRLLALPKFGNDEEPVDAMAEKVNQHLCQFTRDQADLVGLHHFLVVVINNGANVTVGHHVLATADGRENDKPVSNGHTPTAGRDTQGVTALLNSILKLSSKHHAGAVHNLRFTRRTINRHRRQVDAMLDSFFKRGGTQCMITITSREELLDALKHPEHYSHLLVRVGGYSARFIDLPDDMKVEIVNRNAY